MSDLEIINSSVAQAGFVLAQEILPDFGEERAYIVPIAINGNVSVKGSMEKLTRRLKDLGLSIQVVIVDDRNKLIQQSIMEMLRRNILNLRNVVISSQFDGVNVFVEVVSDLSAKEIIGIRTQISGLLALFGIDKPQVHFSANSHRPTSTEIIATIRTFAPTSLSILLEKIIEQGYDVPSIEWLNHRVDSIRRSNFVFMKKNGTYTLTLKALLEFGSGKDRRSPDVHRFLALAKRIS